MRGHYHRLAAVVLALAAFNLSFRLGSEAVSEWDESLYAISAWEMGKSGDLIATTFLGQLDYYNTKPPLNVWLIALSFKAFGTNLVSLRLVSALSAWLTVAVLLEWTRRSFGPAIALFAGVVLATSFGFIYVHAGRTADTDALFTLLVLLTVVTLSAEQRRPWIRIWLGPLAAAVFLLKGAAVLMPLALVVAVHLGRGSIARNLWRPTLAAALLFALPAAAWSFARWRVDEWRFFERMVNYDLLARSLTVIEDHPGTPLYYLNILQKHHYDWLVAGAAALMLFPVPGRGLRDRIRTHDGMLVIAWAAITFLIPTMIRTKLAWYLNPFYPAFALAIGWLVARGFTSPGTDTRRAILAAVVGLSFGVAEAKLIWYSYANRDVNHSSQGMLLDHRPQLEGRRVFRDRWNTAEIFVVDGVIGAEHRVALRLEDFQRESRPGDCLVTSHRVANAGLLLVRRDRHDSLYCRVE